MLKLAGVPPGPRNTPQQPLRIVAIGGGTGLSTLLKGLKRHARGAQGRRARKPHVDITAIVAVTDDGGSSGRLRREFDILPPGDIRNCMAALSEDEALLSRLFQYRFLAGRGLKGHSFGNLFLTAMNQITGDFAQTVKLSSEILAIRGKIIPSTSSNVTLQATLADGTVVQGESRISKSRRSIDRVTLVPNDCRPLPETLRAIAEADLITLGPGSLYTSVIPNVLVHGVAEAIKQSPALKVYFVNLMWQPGETLNLTASQHVQAIHQHANQNLIDYAVLNTAPISLRLRKRYAEAHALPVANDTDQLDAMGVKVIRAGLVGDAKLVRHDSEAAAKIAVNLAFQHRLSMTQIPEFEEMSKT